MQRMRRAICSPRGQLTISLSGPAACMCRHSNSVTCAGSGLDHLSNKEDEMTSNRRLMGRGATALSLALAVATPAFAVGLRSGGAMHVGSGGLRGDQAIVGPVVSSADASYCAQRWAYYDPASGKYMGDDGEWHPCPG